MQSSPQSTAVESTEPKTDARSQDAAKLPKTTGEKWFGAIRFATGESVILATTAALAYIAHPVYGKDKYGPVPNVLKSFQGWLYNKMPEFAVKISPLKEHISKRVGFAFASTTLLMHGGNLFAPFMKKIEDSKEPIVSHLNAHYGKPGEVETGKARLRKEPKQNWGDIIKGRLLSWGFVFTSFVGADALLGRDNAGAYRFDKFEEWFGKKVASLTTKGREVMATPLFHENKAFRFGKILALDIYATAAALTIWITISKLSAAKRARNSHKPEKELIDIASDITIREHKSPALEPGEKKDRYAPKIGGSKKEILHRGASDFRTRTENAAPQEMAL